MSPGGFGPRVPAIVALGTGAYRRSQGTPQEGMADLYRVRDGTLPHAEFRVLRRPIRRPVARLLRAGQTCGMAKTEGVCREVRKVYEALWTFVRVAGVEPPNHAAERAIRPGGCGAQAALGPRVPTGRALSKP
jgi:hypothetical protein